MQVSHTPTALSAAFDEPNLIAAAGLVPVMELARDSGLHELADRQLSVPTDKGANAGAKTAALVAGMAAGADSIDDMTVLRHGGMIRLFGSCYAPLDPGILLAVLLLRARPPARRRCLSFFGKPRKQGTAVGRSWCRGVRVR